MKHTVRSLLCGLVAATPLLLLSGCYTQMGVSRWERGEDYDSQTAATDTTSSDSTQPGDYDTARREFYYDSCYPDCYPVYGAAIGFGWGAPWYGCSYPWGFYDPWLWYGGFYPYGYWGYGYHGGRYFAGGGYYYGRGYATRGFGMVRTGGGSRGVVTGQPAGYGRSPVPATRPGAVVAPGGRGRVASGGSPSRGRAGVAASRNRPAGRGPAARSAPAGTRYGGRGYSAPAGHAPSGGGGGSRGGGGGSRGGGGGGSHGGGGRR